MSVIIESPRRPRLSLIDLKTIPQFAKETEDSVLLRIPKGYTLRPSKFWHENETGYSKVQDATASGVPSDVEAILELFLRHVEQRKVQLVEELKEIADSASRKRTR